MEIIIYIFMFRPDQQHHVFSFLMNWIPLQNPEEAMLVMEASYCYAYFLISTLHFDLKEFYLVLPIWSKAGILVILREHGVGIVDKFGLLTLPSHILQLHR